MSDEQKVETSVRVERGLTEIRPEWTRDRVYVRVLDYAGKEIFHGLAGEVRVEVLAPKEKA